MKGRNLVNIFLIIVVSIFFVLTSIVFGLKEREYKEGL